MILLEKCPLCGGMHLKQIIKCMDHTASKESFNIVSCETCGFTLTNPRPSQSEIGRYYDSEMYISHTNSSKGIFNWTYQTIRKLAIKQKVSLLKKESRIGAHLDIGCGTGEFLNACKKEGFVVEGVEPSVKAKKQAEKNYKLKVSDDISLKQYKEKQFDSISMWHVLEHVTELDKTLSEINRILKSNGKLFVAVPNHKSWDAKHYKQYWAAWDVPIHLWHFSEKTISILLKKHDLSLVRSKGMMFDSFYVSLLSEEFAYGRKNPVKAFVAGIVSNLFGLFSNIGYSSMIYIFEKKH